jgi:D-amino-acid dehydrogenase
VGELERAKQYGVAGEILDTAGDHGARAASDRRFQRRDPFSAPGFVPDPGGLAKAYSALFGRKGGRYLVGDARTARTIRRRWRVATLEGTITARDVVVAMGPWSDLIFAPLGYSIPLQVKRVTICISSRAAMRF